MLKGKVHKYGADVDTDAIISAYYLILMTFREGGDKIFSTVNRAYGLQFSLQ